MSIQSIFVHFVLNIFHFIYQFLVLLSFFSLFSSVRNGNCRVVLFVGFLLSGNGFSLLFGFLRKFISGFFSGFLFLLFLILSLGSSFFVRSLLSGFLFSSFLVSGNLISLFLSLSCSLFLGELSSKRTELVINICLFFKELLDGGLSLMQFTVGSQSFFMSIHNFTFFFLFLNSSCLFSFVLDSFLLLQLI